MADLWVLWQDVHSEVYMTVPVQQAVLTNTGIRFAHAKRCSDAALQPSVAADQQRSSLRLMVIGDVRFFGPSASGASPAENHASNSRCQVLGYLSNPYRSLFGRRRLTVVPGSVGAHRLERGRMYGNRTLYRYQDVVW